MNNIYQYTDFREYLRDVFKEYKKNVTGFSHRYLARKLGLSTPNFIMLVIQGKRNLSISLCFKLSAFLGHSNEESRYFELLVNFDQAKTHEEKDRHYSGIIAVRHKLKISRIEEWQYEYYSNWYTPVVRELVVQDSFDGDLIKLGRKLTPPITKAEVKYSISLLENLGMIKKKEGKYVQSDPVVSTGKKAASVAVVNFHKKMAALASESFDRHLLNERSITSCTVSISRDDFLEIKKELADLRRKVLTMAQGKKEKERVYQLNLQLFPLSLPREQ